MPRRASQCPAWGWFLGPSCRKPTAVRASHLWGAPSALGRACQGCRRPQPITALPWLSHSRTPICMATRFGSRRSASGQRFQTRPTCKATKRGGLIQFTKRGMESHGSLPARPTPSTPAPCWGNLVRSLAPAPTGVGLRQVTFHLHVSVPVSGRCHLNASSEGSGRRR